ncbi:ATP11, putative [Rhizoctonia solani AG-3 Rhs1AP]|uniref:ATP11, putative n=1 Tax=Rhizoctonia solani AG-3 Rhs1AP TaxID=1086054 RepID=X8JP72_9AGAM|nr:ATP11, putative [Rhizoctonia solani AG-3 Rhs1AP]
MTTLALSRSSPTNNTLTDDYGTVTYDVSTPFSLRSSTTTIKRNGQVLAMIKWGVFGGSELTMGGVSASLNDVFPRTGKLSSFRVFTTADGERLKWKYKSTLQCVSADSGLPLATYNHKLFAGIRNKKSTLDISPNAAHLTDILVVTWVIAEKKAQDERSAASSAGSSAAAASSASGGC